MGMQRGGHVAGGRGGGKQKYKEGEGKIQRRQEEERRKEMTAASWDSSNTAGDRGRQEKDAF